MLFPQNILHLLVASKEFSLPCFLATFLTFPEQLGLSFHATFKILESYCKRDPSLAIEMCSLKLPFTQSLLLPTDHSPLPVGSSLPSNTSQTPGDIISSTNHSSAESECLPFLPAPCRDNGPLLPSSIFSSANHNWLLLYSSESRSLCFTVLLGSEIISQYLPKYPSSQVSV